MWYAAMTGNGDSDWGTGSYDINETIAKVREWRKDGLEDAYVAVIDISGNEPMCVEEIRDIDD